MEQYKAAALAAINEKSALITFVADKIWNFAELSLQEEQSAALYEDALE